MRTGWGRLAAQAQGPVNRKRRRRRPGPAETKGPRAAGRRGSARRAGVLAAGGRMVQKEGQAALEEPQGSPNPAGVPGAPLEPPGAATGPVPGGEETDTETETALGSRRFLCGVVEGESRLRGRPGSPGAVWAACSEGGGGLRGSAGSRARLLPRPCARAAGRCAAGGGESRGSRAGRLVLGAAGSRGAPWAGSCSPGLAPTAGRGFLREAGAARRLACWCVLKGGGDGEDRKRSCAVVSPARTSPARRGLRFGF